MPVKLIQRLYDVNKGRVTIGRQTCTQRDPAALRAQIAIVQQETDPVPPRLTTSPMPARSEPGEVEAAARLATHDFIVVAARLAPRRRRARSQAVGRRTPACRVPARLSLADAPIPIPTRRLRLDSRARR